MTPNLLSNALIFVASVMLIGCGNDRRLEKLELDAISSAAKIGELEKQVVSLKGEIEYLDSLHKIQETTIHDLAKLDNSTVRLIPGEENYARLNFGLGVVGVKIVRVDQIASGSKVTMEITNPLAVVVDGINFTTRYGKFRAEAPKIQDITNQKTKEISLVKALPPAATTPVSFLLEGVQPSELDYIVISDALEKGLRAFITK